jgi:hypothetical protein
MTYDCTIAVRLFSTEEGGRRTDLKTQEYRVPIVIGEKAYEARIYPSEKSLPVAPGGSFTAEVKFLNPELVDGLLRPGTEVKILEGKVVGIGEVI